MRLLTFKSHFATTPDLTVFIVRINLIATKFFAMNSISATKYTLYLQFSNSAVTLITKLVLHGRPTLSCSLFKTCFNI